MTTLEKDKAQTDPASVFEKPADVVASKELSPKQKTRALQEWELEARLLEVATEEGMNNKTAPSVLPEIKTAQQKLGADPIKDDGAPTKF